MPLDLAHDPFTFTEPNPGKQFVPLVNSYYSQANLSILYQVHHRTQELHYTAAAAASVQ